MQLPSNDLIKWSLQKEAVFDPVIEGKLIAHKIRCGELKASGVVACGILGHSGAKRALPDVFKAKVIWGSSALSYGDTREICGTLVHFTKLSRWGAIGILDVATSALDKQYEEIKNSFTAHIAYLEECFRKSKKPIPLGPQAHGIKYINDLFTYERLLRFALIDSSPRKLHRALTFANGSFDDIVLMTGLRKNIYREALGDLYAK